MGNPFAAMRLAAAVATLMMSRATVTAFHHGVAPRGLAFGQGTGKAERYHRTSHRTIAQDKRDARKARNRKNHKRHL